MGGVLDYFPYSSPRSHQLKAINEISDAIDNGKHFIILNAPTGSGKSAIGTCFANYFAKEYDRSSFILTKTIMLQNQYLEDFKHNRFGVDYKVGKGRSNFTCRADLQYLQSYKYQKKVEKFGNMVLRKPYPCSDGYCVIDKNNYRCEFLKNQTCHYLVAKNEALESDVALLNYDVKIIDNIFGGKNGYNPRYLSVCDEAHRIEERVLNHISLKLRENVLINNLGHGFYDRQWDYCFVEDWFDDLEHLVYEYDIAITIEESNARKAWSEEARLDSLKQIKYLSNRKDEINDNLKNMKKNPDGWVVTRNKTDSFIEFKPLFVKEYAQDYLFKSARVHIFMSGSYGDPKLFREELNISSDDCEIVNAGTNFNFRKNSPIYMCDVGSMSMDTVGDSLNKSIPMLKRIFNKHEEDKGLIHCTSRKVALHILNSFQNTSYEGRLVSYGDLYGYDFPNVHESLQRFKKSEKPLIMVSYSMEEGVDLKYDECRFQVICKVPFPFAGDERIVRRRNLSMDWYNNEALKTLQQMYGRGMRAEDDYCETYILDSRFKGFMYYCKDFPSYMRDAVKGFRYSGLR